jgi:phosphatidylinositol-3-phosphatase
MPQPQTVSVVLTAQPSSISAGQTSVLAWTSTNATSVTITGLGSFAPSGTTTVTPTVTTTYTASAKGSGGTASSSTTVTISGTPGPTVPLFGHIVLVVEENHGYSEVIGNSSMPYLNGLAAQYGLATQYFANAHPSIPNYFMLTTGQFITLDDSFTGTVGADNLVRRLIAGGKTWKSYAESLPTVGYAGGDSYPYLRRHNPFSYLSDVVNSSTQKLSLVPFSQFSSDLQNNQLPQFSFVVPNALNDAHDGSLSQADTWLHRNIAPLIASPQFQQDGLLIIVFDEAADTDLSHGGGHVAAVVVSPRAKAHYQSTTVYQHEAVLRLILQGLGLTSFPGAAAASPSMAEFF